MGYYPEQTRDKKNSYLKRAEKCDVELDRTSLNPENGLGRGNFAHYCSRVIESSRIPHPLVCLVINAHYSGPAIVL